MEWLTICDDLEICLKDGTGLGVNSGDSMMARKKKMKNLVGLMLAACWSLCVLLDSLSVRIVH